MASSSRLVRLEDTMRFLAVGNDEKVDLFELLGREPLRLTRQDAP